MTKPVIDIVASKRTGDWHETHKALVRITINGVTGQARYKAFITPGQPIKESLDCDESIKESVKQWLGNEPPVVMGFPSIPHGETGDQSLLR